jgi:hypothetical protein
MGYALATGHCLLCKRLFSFNPVRVPSFRVQGSREPICQDCIEKVNIKRVDAGVPPFHISPDAYEACDEGELE